MKHYSVLGWCPVSCDGSSARATISCGSKGELYTKKQVSIFNTASKYKFGLSWHSKIFVNVG